MLTRINSNQNFSGYIRLKQISPVKSGDIDVDAPGIFKQEQGNERYYRRDDITLNTEHILRIRQNMDSKGDMVHLIQPDCAIILKNIDAEDFYKKFNEANCEPDKRIVEFTV